MSDSRKKFAFLFGKVAFVIVAALGAILACLSYPNWSAERKARKFCDEIDIGSDISLAIEKANDKKSFYGDDQGYTFYFPGMVFDKAVCQVSVDANRKVTSKMSEMEYD
jgi:hypothetical protein